VRAIWLLVALLAVIPRAGWSQGDPVGPEFRVNTSTTDDQAEAAVAADSAGNFVVVWGQHYFPLRFITLFGQRYASSGTPLGSEFVVTSSPPDGLYYPSVAADSAGNFVVVWVIGYLEGTDIRGQRYASSGTPLGSEFVVNAGFGPTHSAVAADSSGNFVVVWAEPYNQPSDIFGHRYDSSGAPLGSAFPVNTYVSGQQTNPAVAADSGGNFVVVWSGDGLGDSNGVFGRRYASSGTPLALPFRVNTYTTNNQDLPSVVVDPSGNFVVVWQSPAQDGSSEGVFGQRYASSGAPLGPEFRVNTFTTGFQRNPSVTTDSSGNFVVLWNGAGLDDPGGIFGQRYAASGAPLGPEFRVNTYATNDQSYASVAAGAAGNFVVVWESNLQDGSQGGIFGQRYNMILPVELMHFRVE